MDKNNIRRVRNILSGDYTGKTLTSVGYETKEEKHVEGDVWEEGGREWTIKNGIKRNVTKLDSVRQATTMPLTCPECHTVMRKRSDKRMWKLKGKCLDCVIEEDTERIKKGTFDQGEKEVIANNMTNYLDQVGDFFADYVEGMDAKHFVTEQGDVEDWQAGYSKEQLTEMFASQLKDFKKQIEDYKKSEKR